MITELNPKIFGSDNQILFDVRAKLIEVVDLFLSEVAGPDWDRSPIPVLDVVLVGSNAGYNYTPESDIDLHIITDFSRISQTDPDLVGRLMNAERRIFNKDYDPIIKGHEVEVYVEDIRTPVTSNGIYSVVQMYWIKFPEVREDPEIDMTENSMLQGFVADSERLLNSGTVREVQEFIDNLYLIRKYSIAREGEFSEGNLLFKEIRRRGILDKLKQRLLDLRTDYLTIEGIKIEEI